MKKISDNSENTGYLSGPGLENFPVTYENIDGMAIHEGCMHLGTVEEAEQEAQRLGTHQSSVESIHQEISERDETDVQMGVGISTNSSYLWKNGVVPYTINSKVPDQSRVSQAIAHIEANTSIRFVRRTSSNASRYPNYVEIISNGNAGTSWSKVGMRGRRQELSLSDRHGWQILVHEFLHTLGMYHEQSRSDRDKYIDIQWDNISNKGQFQKKPNTTDYFDYDYDSIMHYPRSSFAVERGKPTIITKPPGIPIGQREGLSFGDRQSIEKMYHRFLNNSYAGVWRAGTGRYGLWVNSSWSSFKSKWSQWSKDGLRLQDIHVQNVNGKTRYSGVFLPGSGKYGLWSNASWESFKSKWEEWNGQGLRLIDLNVHRVNGKNRYTGVFVKGSGNYGLWVNSSWSSFKKKWEEWNKKGLRLHNIHVHRINGKNRYSGVFLPGSGKYGLWVNASWASFVAKWKEWSGQGLRLEDLSVHKSGNETRFSGVFLAGSGGHYLWANTSFNGLKTKWQELAEKNLRLVDLEITNLGDQHGAADGVHDNSEDYYREELPEFGGIFNSTESMPEISDLTAIGDGGMGGDDSEIVPIDDEETEGMGAAFLDADTDLSVDAEHQGQGGVSFADEFEEGEREDGLFEEGEGYAQLI